MTIPSGLCQCGCGGRTRPAKQSDSARRYVKGEPYRFLPGHNQKLHKRTDGLYFVVYAPEHPKATPQGAVYAHILIAERALGKHMPVAAEVHHVDENKQNNANRNLVICQDKAYHKLLHARAKVVRAGGNPNTQKVCCDCHRVKDLTEFNVMRANKWSGRQSLCRECGKKRDAAKRARLKLEAA